MNNIEESLVDDYKKNIIISEENNVLKMQLGYVENNCDVMIFSILYHCIENKDIFTNKQWKNILEFSNYINKIIN